MAASSSSAAHPTGNNQWYHAFLNHRGVDVKKTFARSLYLRLLDKGLTPFLDQEDLQGGYNFPSQIHHAIRTASVHVAIFSPRYAESYWCLNELILMLESKAPIIPVFYRVTAAEVRWIPKDGNYDRALKKLAEKRTEEGELRYDPNTIKNWRNALSQVADNSGFELQTCNGEELELELVDKVVECLLKLVMKPDLHVAEYPTGLDYKLKDFEDTVLLHQQQSGKPRILGIVGLGGIGKTTLAKELFNRKKLDYPRSCFLSDVKGTAKGSLKSLQRTLLKALTLLHEPIDSVDEGKGMLIEPLKSLNALVVLDDVDDVDQVTSLLPVQPHELCSGSLILITSRDRSVLISSKLENSSIYKLTELNRQHSQELLCSYALGLTYPLPGSEDVVDKFLESCNGLPLALKVLGAHLYGRETSEWDDEVGIFPTKVKECLKISYDALNSEEQRIFLDIACFFKEGLNRDTAISMWNASGWKGRRGFQNLQDKCLIEADRRNVIRMHEQLRDLGREIAEKSSPFRLWRWPRNIIDDLSQQSSVIAVRGIIMDLSEYNDRNMERVLRGIDTRWLQILKAEGVVVERILRKAELPEILWLCWNNCPFSSLPSWIPLKNLRHLHVSGGELIRLWERESESQLQALALLQELVTTFCVKLKRIEGLTHCTNLWLLNVVGCSDLEELPSMETLVSLEELRTARCVKLTRIQGLAHCTKLRLLNVAGCSELEELPSMETLVSLEDLGAARCVKLKRIEGLSHCTKLRLLNVDGCSELEELPSMETLVFLEELGADRCVKLKRIQGLAQCTKLRLMSVNGCSDLEELISMETLVSLEVFRSSECVKLKRIQGLEHCTKLRLLHVVGCSELEELPSMEAMVSLEELRAARCVKLTRIQGLAYCTKLRLLDVDRCSELEELPSMEKLVSLQGFGSFECVKLKWIQGLVHCTNLRSLHVVGCSELEELPSMATLVSLEELTASRCVKLTRIQGLAHCTKLRSLDVAGCSELEELPTMETLISLEELGAATCVKVKRIQGLAHCTKLRMLQVDGCSELKELPSMETLVSLEGFSSSECVKLKRIHGLGHCTKLRWLYVEGCSKLEELASMETLVSLEELRASRCVKLTRIQGLAHCTKLRLLYVGGCSELEELPSMETLVSLDNFRSYECVKLKRIQGLGHCTKLRWLYVEGCSKLEELPSMETLVSLEELRASRCVKLTRIPGLANCTKLRVLFVDGCSELEELPSMETLVSLEHFLSSKCVKLKTIQGLDHCTKLQVLYVDGCC